MFYEGSIKMEYITNCAVLIQCGTVVFLVDGIFSGRQPFDVMAPETERALLCREGRFKNLQHILVTHCHNDHYNGSKILRFLERRPGSSLVVPANARLDQNRLVASDARVIFMKGEVGELHRIFLDEVTIEYMKTEHLTYRYPEHYCINIAASDANVLLTADMELDRLGLLERFTKRTHSAIFVNQICLWHKRWQLALNDLGYSHIYFYHLPSEERDEMGYRRRALIYWDKHRKKFPNAVLLDGEVDRNGKTP